MPTAICPNCSRPVAYAEKAEQVFCIWCGASITPVQDSSDLATRHEDYARYRRKKKVPIGGIAVLAGCFVAIIISLFIYRAAENRGAANKQQAANKQPTASPNKRKESNNKERPIEQAPTQSETKDSDELTVGEAGIGITFLILLIVTGALFYLLPTFVAVIRGHGSWPAIAVLNILLGLTGICWIIALIWSFTEVRSREHIHRHYQY